MDLLELSAGERALSLARPDAGRTGLRAWDAADEQLIAAARPLASEGARVAIVDDSFGALSLALADLTPVSVADSAVLPAALAANARANDLMPGAVSSWLMPPTGPFDLVIMKLPRQVDYLAYLLRWANDALAPDGRLLAGGMIKHLPDRCAEKFDSLVRTEEVHRARRKARLLECRPGRDGLAGWSGLWRGYTTAAPPGGLDLQGLPAVFGRERLDIGSRLLLEPISSVARELAAGARVLDLACGNGLLGLTALAANPDLVVNFADVSSQAVASATRNATGCFAGARAAFFHCDGVPGNSGVYDLILLNPPFHEGGTVGDHIALRLFQQASRVLAPQGRMLVVGNRHLGYHRSLRQWFRVRQLDADPRFVVFEARPQEGGRS
ncbi:MAG: methyltransferase [Marinobacter sp.]|uniref:class I SAM-dependent methyltransferase n=1 Tax=Marinobacter sp. TaxID=50741 RepID=UPI00299D7821|nr:methyltransferase [Marinobacter sp.]MDX1633359.1 methyltransferase [Marinobacter sp.]